MKVVLLLIIIVVALSGSIFYVYPFTREISGMVLDCESDLPIGGVEIIVRSRGWGIVGGSVVWDKDFFSNARSNERGAFHLETSHVPDIWEVRKENYLITLQDGMPSNPLELRMLRGTSTLESYNCRKSSECLQCEVKDGIKTCQNICE